MNLDIDSKIAGARAGAGAGAGDHNIPHVVLLRQMYAESPAKEGVSWGNNYEMELPSA